MPYKIDIYIGSDNGTRRITKGYFNKIRKWADSNFPDGYTLIRGRGYYHGIQEDSLLINVLSGYDTALKDGLEVLKHELAQEAILVAKTQVDLQVV